MRCKEYGAWSIHNKGHRALETNVRTLSSGRAPGKALRRVPALAGITALLLFWIVLIIAGLIRPGYDPVRQAGSELGVGPHAWLMNGTFILWGLLQLCFAWGLDRGILRRSGLVPWWLGPVLLAVSGIAMILVGVFPLSHQAPYSVSATMHGRAAKVLYASLVGAYLVLPSRLRRDERWHAYARYTFAAGLLGLVLFILNGWSRGFLNVPAWFGLEQRLLLAVILGWSGVLALRLYAVETGMEGAARRNTEHTS